MTLREIQTHLDAEILSGEDQLDKEVREAFACDLISEMLASVSSHVLLITSLTNAHVIHTAEVMDALGVIFVGGRRPSEEIIEIVKKNGSIPLLSTKCPMFDCCGLLFAKGIQADRKDASPKQD